MRMVSALAVSFAMYTSPIVVAQPTGSTGELSPPVGGSSSPCGWPDCPGECFCSENTREFWSRVTTSSSYELILSPPGCMILAAAASGVAQGVGLFTYNATGYRCFDPLLPADSIQLVADSDAVDLLVENLTLSATVGPGALGGASGSVFVDAGALAGSRSKTDEVYSYDGEEVYSTVVCCAPLGGRSFGFEFGTAFASTARSYAFSAGCTVTYNRERSYSNSFGFDTFEFCTESGGRTTNPELLRVDFVSDVVTSSPVLGSTPTQDVSQGVYAVYTDGSVVRLGLYQNAAFDPVPNGNGFSVSGTVNDTLVLSGVTAIDFATTRDVFSAFDGNVDGDPEGRLCYADVFAMRTALGSSIGMASYIARADIDLDGDVDVADAAAFQALFSSNGGCTPDLNCDGAADVFDQLQLQNWVAVNDPRADYNGDGAINIFDLTDHANDIAAGC